MGTEAFVKAHAEENVKKRRGTLGASFGRYARQTSGDANSNEVDGARTSGS